MNARKSVLAVCIVACAFPAPSFAYTISGTLPPTPPGKPSAAVEIPLREPLKAGTVTFTFRAPVGSAGTKYFIDYCIGPKNNPCNATLAHDVSVQAGETKTLSIDALVFTCNVLTASQGMDVPVPYSIDVTQP